MFLFAVVRRLPSVFLSGGGRGKMVCVRVRCGGVGRVEIEGLGEDLDTGVKGLLLYSISGCGCNARQDVVRLGGNESTNKTNRSSCVFR